MAETIRVQGLREFQSKIKRADAMLAVEVKNELRKLGDIVKEDATGRGARYQGIGPYKTIVKQKSVEVRQSKGKVTGRRGDFGALQMRTVLEPALDAKSGEVNRGMETMLDGLIATSGL